MAVDRLLGQINHWTSSRFAAAASLPSEGGLGTVSASSHGLRLSGAGRHAAHGGRPEDPPGLVRNADVLHELVQFLADLAADAEGQPARPVPRLADRALPDQLALLTADLLAGEPPGPVLVAAAEAIERSRARLR